MKTLFTRTSFIVISSLLLVTSTAFAAPSESSELLDYAGNGDFSLTNGAKNTASFRSPERIAISADGTIYVADTLNQVIRQVKGDQASTFSGTTFTTDETGAPEGALIDGSADESLFNYPKGIAAGPEEHVYVADTGNHAIRKMDAKGTVTTIAGTGVVGDADGKGTNAQFYGPEGIAVATDGTIYVADTLNHLIRRINPDGQVSTLNAPSNRLVERIPGLVETAGDYQDGPLSEAKFNEPTALVIDENGNLYVSDKGNQVIRYIDLQTNEVTTVAGQRPVYSSNKLYADGGYVDGEASQAVFHSPQGIALTQNGGLVISDRLNHVIRYLHDGQVETLAGIGEASETDGFYSPSDVAVTKDGTVIVVDSYNNKLRQFTLHQNTFTDIQGHWAETHIQKAVNLGMIEGYPDGRFQPNKPINRIEFTAMLVRALKLDGDGASLHFTDQSPNQIPAWAERELSLALEKGLVTGYSDGSFRPNQWISRVEMTAMIMRAIEVEAASDTATSFSDDSSIPNWAKGYVVEAVNAEIIQGRSNNRFVPHDNGTRAEATVMLLRMIEKNE